MLQRLLRVGAVARVSAITSPQHTSNYGIHALQTLHFPCTLLAHILLLSHCETRPFSAHSPMVIVCQKCGVTGFSKDLVYCSQCHLSVEHRYCLDNPPKRNVKKFKWICEQCTPPFSQFVSHQKLNSFPVKRNEQRKHISIRAAIISQNLKRLKGSIAHLVPEAEAGLQSCDVNSNLPTPKPHQEQKNNYSCVVNTKGDRRHKIQRRMILEDGSSSDEKAPYANIGQLRVHSGAIGACKSQCSHDANGNINQEAKKQGKRLILEDESSLDDEMTCVQTEQFPVDSEAIASRRSQVSCSVHDDVDQEVKKHTRKLISVDGSSSDEDIAYVKIKQFRVYADDVGPCLSRGSCGDKDKEVTKQERGLSLKDGSSLGKEIAFVETKEFKVIACQKCGVTGISEDLVFCSQCHLSVEHRYCLDNPPKSNAKKVKWICEQCTPSFSQPFSQQKLNSLRKCIFSHAAIVSQNQEKSNGSIEPLVSEAEAGLQLCDVNPSLPTSKPFKGHRNYYFCGASNKGDWRHKKQRRRVVVEDGSSSDEKATYAKIEQSQVHLDAIGACKDQYSCDVHEKQRRRVILEDESSSDEKATYAKIEQSRVQPEAIGACKSQYSCDVYKKQRKRMIKDGSSSDEKAPYAKIEQLRVHPDATGACESQYSCRINGNIDQEAKKQSRRLILKDESSCLDDEKKCIQTKQLPVDSETIASCRSHVNCAVNGDADQEVKKKHKKKLGLADGNSSDEDIACAKIKQFRVYPDGAGPFLSQGSCCDVGKEVMKQERKMSWVDESSLVKEIAYVKTKEIKVHPDAFDAHVGLSLRSQNACFENNKTDENLKGSNSDENVTCVKEKQFDQEVGYRYYVHAIRDPSWWGYFVIGSQKLGVILAHTSTIACPEACKAVKLMHLSIHMEMLPRLEAWPKSFSVSAPSSNDIALFFFSRSTRDDKVYYELVHHIINEDLALKAVFSTAELYIYASCQLPQPYWRFGGKYYLWGVFRRRDISSPKPSK